MVRRSRRVFEALLGACCIYTAMAACGGGSGPSSGGHGQGGQGHGGAPGTGGANVGPGGSDGSGIFDALMDPVHDAMADPVSGTRLKATWIESVDGARQYLFNTETDPGTGVPITRNVWFDSMRNEECVFRFAADSKIRCLPGAPPMADPPLAYVVVFADAACSQAIVLTQEPPLNCAPYDPPTYAYFSVQPDNTCQAVGQNGQVRVFKLGAQVTTGPNTPIYEVYGTPPTCNGGNTVGAHGAYAAMEVDASQFALVKAAVQHD
jgi:hypothetical protein